MRGLRPTRSRCSGGRRWSWCTSSIGCRDRVRWPTGSPSACTRSQITRCCRTPRRSRAGHRRTGARPRRSSTCPLWHHRRLWPSVALCDRGPHLPRSAGRARTSACSAAHTRPRPDRHPDGDQRAADHRAAAACRIFSRRAPPGLAGCRPAASLSRAASGPQVMPAVSPFTNQRCMTRTTTTGGASASSADAMTRFHSGTAKL
jgi:hypothetical protein